VLSDELWRRASAAGASTPLEKRAFGIADDMQVFFFSPLQQKMNTKVYMHFTKQLWSWAASCIHVIHSILQSGRYGWYLLAGDSGYFNIVSM
jgi:hypothetical protein